MPGLAQSPAPIDYKSTRAGGGGALRTLFWQAPTSLNPHFAVGAKDAEGAGIFYEPLAAWEPNGNLVSVLAAEIHLPCGFASRNRRRFGRVVRTA
jgi:peptide/nickel transport system substrate-binding protein